MKKIIYSLLLSFIVFLFFNNKVEAGRFKKYDIVNLKAESHYSGYVELSWDIKDKEKIAKVEISRKFLPGNRWDILCELDPNEEFFYAKQDIISYAMYKVRVIYYNGKKSLGQTIKTIPKPYSFKYFYFYTSSNKYTPYEVFEIQNINGVDYILIEDIYNIVSYYFGEINYIKTKNNIKINTLDNNIKISFDLNKNKATFSDKTGNSINEIVKKIQNNSQVARLKTGTSSNLDIQIEKNSENFNDIFDVSLKTNSIELYDYNLKIVKMKNKNYFPVHLISPLIFDNYIEILEYDECYGFTVSPHTQNEYKRKNMTSSLKDFTINYFINLCKRKYTVAKDKDINFDKLKYKYYTNLLKTETNEEFYVEFRNMIENMGDWHTSISSFGKSIYEVRSTDYKTSLQKKYDAMDDLFLNIPDNKFDKFKLEDLNEDTGYFYLKDYTDDSKKHIDKMIRKFQNKKTIIIDERWNPGGYTDMLLYLLEYLADDEFHINFYKNNVFYSKTIKNNRQLRYKGNIILLTNRASYSAATFFAAIAKENNLVTIIGEKTNGGASPTVSFVLPDNSTVNISSEVLITDSKGNSFDNGVEPNIYIEDSYSEGKDQILEKAIEYANSL